jgi:hypothetical protein
MRLFWLGVGLCLLCVAVGFGAIAGGVYGLVTLP